MIMQWIAEDVRGTMRSMVRRPYFTAAIALVMALGLGASVLMFSVVTGVLMYDLPFAQPDQLWQVTAVRPDGNPGNVLVADYLHLKDRAKTFTGLAAYRFQPVTLQPEGERMQNVFATMMAPGAFETLKPPMQMGRVFDAATKEPAVVISSALWRELYQGRPNIIGEALTINGTRHTIVAVAPAAFQFPRKDVKVWLPWRIPADQAGRRDARVFGLVGRARMDTSLPAISAELASIGQSLAREFPATNLGWKIKAVAIREHANARFSSTLWYLAIAVFFVLLIACLNITALMLSQVSDRAGEIALRVALGASRLRVLCTLIVESVLRCSLGGLLGLGLAFLASRHTVGLFAGRLPVPRLDEVGIGAPAVLFALLLTVAVSLAVGVLPALHSSRLQLQEAIRSGGGKGGTRLGAARFRNSLIGIEVALSFVLVLSAWLIIRNFIQAMTVNPGFNSQNLYVVELPSPVVNSGRQPQQLAAIAAEVAQTPGVSSVAVTSVLPLAAVAVELSLQVKGAEVPPGKEPMVPYRAVSPRYFSTMGIPLTAGRDFTASDDGMAPGVAIVSEALARKYWPGENAIGRHLKVGVGASAPWISVVGVVGDVRHSSLGAPSDGEVYRPLEQLLGPAQGTHLVMRGSARPELLAKEVRTRIQQTAPAQPLGRFRAMTEVMVDSVAFSRFLTVLLSAFAAIAMILAAAGLFGLMSYNTSKREREFGIRLSMGATPRSLQYLVFSEAVKIVLLGVAVGLAAMVWVRPVLASYVPGQLTLEALSVFICVLTFTGASLCACAGPVLRARATPLTTLLRNE